MTDAPVVLDASAVLAAFFNERGADRIVERMSGALLSTVNYAEVVAKLADCGTPAEQILEIMAQLDVKVVPVDREQAGGGAHHRSRLGGHSGRGARSSFSGSLMHAPICQPLSQDILLNRRLLTG